VILWTIWAATMFGGFPWPAIVNAFALLNLLRTMANHREIVAQEVRRLEKKRAKELGTRKQPPTEPGPDTAP
jgi:hypothetical protein